MILFVGSDEDFDGGGIAWTHRDVSEANKAMVAVTKRSRIEYFLWLHFAANYDESTCNASVH